MPMIMFNGMLYNWASQTAADNWGRLNDYRVDLIIKKNRTKDISTEELAELDTLQALANYYRNLVAPVTLPVVLLDISRRLNQRKTEEA